MVQKSTSFGCLMQFERSQHKIFSWLQVNWRCYFWFLYSQIKAAGNRKLVLPYIIISFQLSTYANSWGMERIRRNTCLLCHMDPTHWFSAAFGERQGYRHHHNNLAERWRGWDGMCVVRAGPELPCISHNISAMYFTQVCAQRKSCSHTVLRHRERIRSSVRE